MQCYVCYCNYVGFNLHGYLSNSHMIVCLVMWKRAKERKRKRVRDSERERVRERERERRERGERSEHEQSEINIEILVI